LQLTPIVEKPVLTNYELQYEYNLINEVMTFVKRYGCVILENEMQLFCRMVIGVPKAEESVFVDRIVDIHGVEVRKL
jgi:putative IMPACT (imprinted ancient) family translation regulator